MDQASEDEGGRQQAFAAIESFKRLFDARDAAGIAALFAPDAILLGTLAQAPVNTSAEILAYFREVFARHSPSAIDLGDSLALPIDDAAFLFSGQDTLWLTQEGALKAIPARFTFVVTNSRDGWKISHFHSSMRPSGL